MNKVKLVANVKAAAYDNKVLKKPGLKTRPGIEINYKKNLEKGLHSRKKSLIYAPPLGR